MATDQLPPEVTVADRTWLGEIGLLVVAVTLFVLEGPVGLAIGVVIGLSWLLVSGPIVVAGGHVLSLIAFGGEPAIVALVAMEGGFLAVLVAPLLAERAWTRTVGTTAALAVGLGGLSWFGWHAWQPRWLVVMVDIVVVAVLVYGVHRYAIVGLETAGVDRR